MPRRAEVTFPRWPADRSPNWWPSCCPAGHRAAGTEETTKVNLRRLFSLLVLCCGFLSVSPAAGQQPDVDPLLHLLLRGAPRQAIDRPRAQPETVERMHPLRGLAALENRFFAWRKEIA